MPAIATAAAITLRVLLHECFFAASTVVELLLALLLHSP